MKRVLLLLALSLGLLSSAWLLPRASTTDFELQKRPRPEPRVNPGYEYDWSNAGL